jgi:cation diffusion facilitator CzcD-associated flavoprotein CzcO
VAIIGGGIAGLIHLHNARRAGLRTVLLGKAAAVGGLWRELPAWQDIQICPADWTVGDLPIEGPMQSQVLAHIESWVSRFGLEEDIHAGCAVSQVRHDGMSWVLDNAPGSCAHAPPGGCHRRAKPALDAKGSTARRLGGGDSFQRPAQPG